MIKVAPSILSADYVNLQKSIEEVDKAEAEEIKTKLEAEGAEVNLK